MKPTTADAERLAQWLNVEHAAIALHMIALKARVNVAKGKPEFALLALKDAEDACEDLRALIEQMFNVTAPA